MIGFCRNIDCKWSICNQCETKYRLNQHIFKLNRSGKTQTPNNYYIIIMKNLIYIIVVYHFKNYIMEEYENFKVLGKKTINWIQKNPKKAASIPVGLGGFWQFSELISMGIPYGRYFSVPQLLADGLLILFFMGLLILASVFFTRILGLINALKDKYDREGRSDFLQILSFAGMISALLIIMFTILLIFYRPFPSLLHIVVIFFGMFISITITTTVVYYLEKYRKKLREKRDSRQKMTQTDKQILYGLIVTFIPLFALGLLIMFHSFLLLPTNFRNLDYVNCQVNKVYPDYQHHIRYFNDKYIFVEIKMSADENKIEKFKYDDLFNSKACLEPKKGD